MLRMDMLPVRKRARVGTRRKAGRWSGWGRFGASIAASALVSAAASAQPVAGHGRASAATVIAVESLGRELQARASAEDAIGVAALIDTSALVPLLRQLVAAARQGGGRMGPTPSAAQRRELDPGITEQELQLATALDSLRAQRAPGMRDVNLMGFALPADTVASLGARRYLERLFAWSVEQRRALRRMCPPSPAPPPPPGGRSRFLGAIAVDDSTALLVTVPGSMMPGIEPAPQLVAPPEPLPVDRTRDGWRLRWSVRAFSLLTDNGIGRCS